MPVNHGERARDEVEHRGLLERSSVGQFIKLFSDFCSLKRTDERTDLKCFHPSSSCVFLAPIATAFRKSSYHLAYPGCPFGNLWFSAIQFPVSSHFFSNTKPARAYTGSMLRQIRYPAVSSPAGNCFSACVLPIVSHTVDARGSTVHVQCGWQA